MLTSDQQAQGNSFALKVNRFTLNLTSRPSDSPQQQLSFDEYIRGIKKGWKETGLIRKLQRGSVSNIKI